MLILTGTSSGKLKEDMQEAILLATQLNCIINIVVGCDFHIKLSPKADIESEWQKYLERTEPWRYDENYPG